jgi:hypothetical protein
VPGGLTLSRPPLVVELVGPAGVGKSTLLGALNGRGLAAGRSIWGQPVLPLLGTGLQLLPILFRFWRQSPALLWDESRHMVRLKTLSRAVRHGDLLRGRVVVFDEGPLFALAWLRGFGHESMRSEAADVWWRATLREWAEVMDAVVVLDAPDSVLAQRIRARPDWHEVKQDSDQEIAIWMARFRAALNWVLAHMAVPDGPVILRVRTEQETPGRIAELVAAALEQVPYDD